MRFSLGACALCVVLAAGCASRVEPPPLPAALAYPDLLFPTVPDRLTRVAGAPAIERGWRFLQNNDLRAAEREFESALMASPGLYPAQTGLAYVALARRDHNRALGGFGSALQAAPTYVPALVGQGQALLALGRDTEALTAFEAALAADASLTVVRSRVDVLRFRNLQELIEQARAAAAAGRLEDARAAYARTLDASPDSAFLHRELGMVERRRGVTPAALEHFRRAVELDPTDAMSFVQMGELLDAQQDLAGAEAAYRRALAIEPNPDLVKRMAALAERARDARLPAEFRALSGASQITRGELAALVGIRLEPVVRNAPPREVVATDIRGHWAEVWIAQVARAGVIEPFANHTFQPHTPLRRADLALATSRVVALLATTNPALRTYLTARPAVADVSPGHLDYPAVSVAVASGVLPLLDGNRFQVTRPVSGAEALDAVNRLQALASR